MSLCCWCACLFVFDILALKKQFLFSAPEIEGRLNNIASEIYSTDYQEIKDYVCTQNRVRPCRPLLWIKMTLILCLDQYTVQLYPVKCRAGDWKRTKTTDTVFHCFSTEVRWQRWHKQPATNPVSPGARGQHPHLAGRDSGQACRELLQGRHV